MANEGTISPGITNVGERPLGSYYAYSNKQHKPPQITQLKAGEIVLGTVLDNPEFSIAPVRLPQGIFRAQLQGNLRKGDSLFFIVHETLPSLMLKIHSVSIIKNGETLSPQEIVRILDIPLSDHSIKLAAAITDIRRIVERKTLAHCVLFWDLPESRAILKKLDFGSALSTMLHLTEAANLESNTFQQFYPVFRRSELVLNDLLTTTDLLNELHKCLSPEDFVLFYKSVTQSTAEHIKSLANSLNLWNIYASQNNKTLLHCFVLPFADTYAAVSVSVENKKAYAQAGAKTYLTSNLALTLLKSDLRTHISQLKSLDSKKAATYLLTVASDMQKSINNDAYSLTSFKVSSIDFIDSEFASAPLPAASTNFSVVV